MLIFYAAKNHVELDTELITKSTLLVFQLIKSTLQITARPSFLHLKSFVCKVQSFAIRLRKLQKVN